MKNNTAINRLRQIANNSDISAMDKRYIVQTSDKLDIPFRPRSGCSDCYREQAILLWRRLSEQEALKDQNRNYLLRAGVDVVWRGIRINATCTDDQLAEYVEHGFSKSFFLRLP